MIFINKAPIYWYSKEQPTVEANTFDAKICAMKVAVEMTEATKYKLRKFGVSIKGAASVFCNNEAVYQNTVVPESIIKESL